MLGSAARAPAPAGGTSTPVSAQDVSWGEPSLLLLPLAAGPSSLMAEPFLTLGRGRVLGPCGGQSKPLVLHVLKSQPFTTQTRVPANQQGGPSLARPSLETGVHSQSHHPSAKVPATQGAEQPRGRERPGWPSTSYCVASQTQTAGMTPA